jgi:glutaredoxin
MVHPAVKGSYHRCMQARVTLFERTDCHLCEEARILLDEIIGPDRYDRVDIDLSDDLVMRYGFRVPVLAIDGKDRLEAPITAPDLRDVLEDR